MKLESKYFDSIRIKSARTAVGAARVQEEVPNCEWKGCTKPGPHKAAKGRGQEGHFFAFCADHVRSYNATYNYFEGMSDDQVSEYRKDAQTGHRPTWKVGANAWSHGTHRGSSSPEIKKFAAERDARNKQFAAWRANRTEEQEAASERQERPIRAARGLKPLEKKAMTSLGLDERASKDDVKARFKDLVKRHHPDANGGDRGSEEKLREIIQAYNYLKQAGLV